MPTSNSHPTEIELKFKLDDHEEIRARLRNLGAQPAGTVIETNRIFDDTARSLLAGRRGLRVRSCRNENGEIVSATLTYKGPPFAGQAKQRVEIETLVGDPEATRNLLIELGYVEMLAFEKRRESWTLGKTKIELDELPHLGRYFEIEGPTLEAVHTARDQLISDNAQPVTETYVALVAEYCKQNALNPLAFTF